MNWHKWLGGLASGLLLFVLTNLDAPGIQAQMGFAVSPPVVTIDNLSPGEEAEFNLTICNKGNATRTFVLGAFTPEERRRRPGRAEFPDNSWISFSPQQVEIEADSQASVKVMVAIPDDERWVGQDWEVWLEVSPGHSGMLAVIMYIRLLVSTAEAEPAPVAMSIPASEPSLTPATVPTSEPPPIPMPTSPPVSPPTSNWAMIAAVAGGGALLVSGIYYGVRKVRQRVNPHGRMPTSES